MKCSLKVLLWEITSCPFLLIPLLLSYMKTWSLYLIGYQNYNSSTLSTCPLFLAHAFAPYFLKSLALCKSFRISPSQTIELICKIHKVGGGHRCCLNFTLELKGKCCTINNLWFIWYFSRCVFFYTRDTFLCYPCICLAFSSAPQASGETPWLRTAVSLHLSSVWARVLGG